MGTPGHVFSNSLEEKPLLHKHAHDSELIQVVFQGEYMYSDIYIYIYVFYILNKYKYIIIHIYIYIYIYLYILFRASPAARGQIRAVAASLHHSYGNARLELHLQTTPQLEAMLDS